MGRFLSHIGLVAFIALVALASFGLWVSLKPGEPNLPRYEGLQEKAGDYHPGGPDCQPAMLRNLPSDREGIRQRDACAYEREEQRLKENDLAQQTRSANAAEAVTRLAYNQSVVLVVGAILGMWTLIAAVAAAVFARRASNSSDLSAKLAKKQVSADLISTSVRVAIWGNEGGTHFSFSANNVGQTTARDARLIGTLTVSVNDGDPVEDVLSQALRPAEITGRADARCNIRVSDRPQHPQVGDTIKAAAEVALTFHDAFGDIQTHRYAFWGQTTVEPPRTDPSQINVDLYPAP